MSSKSNFNDENEILSVMPENGDVHVSKNVKILNTNLFCRGCATSPKKYIDTTPGEMLCKYLCNCIDPKTQEANGPVLPMFRKRGA